MKYKIGDRVRVIENSYCHGYLIGGEYAISNIVGSSYLGQNTYVYTQDIELLTKEKRMTITDIKEKFLLAITTEPKKSFRKAGITDGDNFLTSDGEKVFLAWLLEQNATKFKSEVVDDILKEMKEDK